MILLIFLLFIISSPFSWAGGGGSTVGDGGHLVVCQNSMKLLDLYELEVERQVHLKPNFGQPNSMSLLSKVNVGIDRIKHRFNLNEEQINVLRSIARDFIFDHVDPWQMYQDPKWQTILGTKKFRIRRDVYDSIKKENCSIDIVAIRPPKINPDDGFIFTCPQNLECLFLNLNLFKRLDADSRACLIIHEILRDLPKDKRISSELLLRKTAAEICVNQ